MSIIQMFYTITLCTAVLITPVAADDFVVEARSIPVAQNRVPDSRNQSAQLRNPNEVMPRDPTSLLSSSSASTVLPRDLPIELVPGPEQPIPPSLLSDLELAEEDDDEDDADDDDDETPQEAKKEVISDHYEINLKAFDINETITAPPGSLPSPSSSHFAKRDGDKVEFSLMNIYVNRPLELVQLMARHGASQRQLRLALEEYMSKSNDYMPLRDFMILYPVPSRTTLPLYPLGRISPEEVVILVMAGVKNWVQRSENIRRTWAKLAKHIVWLVEDDPFDFWYGTPLPSSRTWTVPAFDAQNRSSQTFLDKVRSKVQLDRTMSAYAQMWLKRMKGVSPPLSDHERFFLFPHTRSGKEDAQVRSLEGIKYVLNHAIYKSVKWILAVDDDTFVHVPRLLAMLDGVNSDLPVVIAQVQCTLHFGAKFPQGGAGMLLSRPAVEKFAAAYPSTDCSLDQSPANDLVMGFCAKKSGILLVDSPFMFRSEYARDHLDDFASNYFVTRHWLTPEQIAELWRSEQAYSTELRQHLEKMTENYATPAAHERMVRAIESGLKKKHPPRLIPQHPFDEFNTDRERTLGCWPAENWHVSPVPPEIWLRTKLQFLLDQD